MTGTTPIDTPKFAPNRPIALVTGASAGLGRRGGFLAPTTIAWAILSLAHWLPRPFEWFMMTWAPGHFAREIGRDRP